MPRPPRVEEPGGVAHVVSRGVDRRPIFDDDVDRRAFLNILGRTVDRFVWRVYAYCLMTNHFHLLVETPAPTLAAGMQFLNGCYACTYNVRHGRCGHLFEQRYHAARVQRDAHLLEACRYVVLNPQRAGLVGRREQALWSSYAATAAGERSRLVAVDELLALFDARDRRNAARRYQSFVADGVRAAA